jgi:hypothetical protein
MRHSLLFILSLLYPSLYEKTNKDKLISDACELGKQTRSSYRSVVNKSYEIFDLIHYDL